MRNLKKVLSLSLAFVMLLGMMVMGSAATKDFDDAAEIKNVEAVDVLTAIGVLEGDNYGNFNPNETLTREQAAKIICYMLMGPDADKLSKNSNIFKDVAAGRWSAGYIAYCYNMGIIAGNGDGTFGPEDKLTGVAFGKMLLTALGYDAEIEGYVNNLTWAANITTQMMETGIDVSGISQDAPLSRDNAAQMALNTIKAPLVEYATKGTNLSVNGAEVTFGAADAEYVTTELANTQTISGRRLTNTGDFTIEFGEKYMPALVLKSGEIDAFGRPSHIWIYATEEIGSYIDSHLLVATYTNAMKGSDLFKLLGRTAVATYDIDIYVDGADVTAAYVGEINKDNEQFFTLSGTGVRTEVFVNTATEEVTIAVINTYLAIATTDYNEKTELATFDIYGVDKVNDLFVKAKTGAEDKVASVKVGGPAVMNIKKFDRVLVTVSGKDVITVEAAPVVSEVSISAFSLGRNVVADGKTYMYAAAAEYDYEVLDIYSANNMKDTIYNLYLDPYGNMIGLEIVSVPDEYVFITGINTPGTDNLNNGVYEVRGIFMDGTTKVFNAMDARGQTTLKDATELVQHNTWYTFTEGPNGLYTLTVVAGAIDAANGVRVAQSTDSAATINIDSKHVSLSGAGTDSYAKVYGNNNTVYLTAKLDTNYAANEVIIVGTSNVTTGVDNANIVTYADGGAAKTPATTDAGLTKVAYTLYNVNGYIIASVVVGDDSTASQNLVYVNSPAPSKEAYANNLWTWTREVIINGEKAELTEVGGGMDLNVLSTAKMAQGSWYVVSYNADGNVIGAELASSAFGTNGNVPPVEYVNTYATGKIGDTIAVPGMETVLYQENLTAAGTLIAQTLYLDKANTHGFRIDENAKIVMIQKNKNVTTTTYDEGINAVEAALDNLNVLSGGVSYVMNALIVDGRAVVVVINDNYDDGYGSTTTDPGAGVTGATATNLTSQDALKNMISVKGAGLYTVPAGASTAANSFAPGVTEANADLYLWFGFNATADNHTLKIVDAEYNTAYAATATLTAGVKTWYVQYKVDATNNGYYCDGTGTWASAAPVAGTYTWSIVNDTTGAVVASGEFTLD